MFPEKINNITYDEFQRIVNAVEEYLTFCNTVYEASKKTLDFFEIDSKFTILCELINLTQKSLNDELDTLEYFIYEINFGKGYKGKCEYDTGDGIIETPFRTVKDLWLYFALDNKLIDKYEYEELLENDNEEE